MANRETDLVRRLLEENEVFRAMKERHAALEDQLQQLEKKACLTPQDELEIKKIKKRKLLFKDKMQKILTDHRARD